MSKSNCISIEYPEAVIEKCSCCEKRVFRLTRFITKHDDAYAVCYCKFTEGHLPPNVSFAVSIGPWWDDDAVSQRRCFTVWYKNLPDSHAYMLRDACDNDWQHVPSLGQFLSRDEALADDSITDMWTILDIMAADDPVLAPYLKSS